LPSLPKRELTQDLKDEHARRDGAFDGDLEPIVPMSETGQVHDVTSLNSAATRWAHLVPVLRPVEKSLMLVLAWHADQYGCSGGGQKTLAAQTDCCERSVRSVFKGFEIPGLIRRISRRGAHGEQLTDVAVLTGWPGRTHIPDTGHPKIGHLVKETPETKLQWIRAQAPANLPDSSRGVRA